MEDNTVDNSQEIDMDDVTVEVETEPEVELELEDDIAEEEVEIEASDDEEDVADDETQVEQEQKEERMVPLSALEAERKKWQQRLNDPSITKAKAIAERLKETTGKDYDSIQAELDRVQINNYVDSGVDEGMAKYIVQQQREMQEFKRALSKQKHDVEIAELKSNKLYKDIEIYRDEVVDHAERTGLPLKSAYLDLFGDALFNDMERQIEQKVLNNVAKKQSKRVDTTSNGVPKVKSKVNLSEVELAIAKAAGMTPTEYFNMKQPMNVEQYKAMQSKKK